MTATAITNLEWIAIVATIKAITATKVRFRLLAGTADPLEIDARSTDLVCLVHVKPLQQLLLPPPSCLMFACKMRHLKVQNLHQTIQSVNYSSSDTIENLHSFRMSAHLPANTACLKE